MKKLLILVILALVHFSCAGATPQDSLEGVNIGCWDENN